MALKDNYNQTLNASYLGYVVQAVVNNFAPLLFLTFQKSYGISLARIAMLVTVNFGIQLAVDLVVGAVCGQDWIQDMHCGGSCVRCPGAGRAELSAGYGSGTFWRTACVRCPVRSGGGSHRSTDQPHCGSLSNGPQRCGHEPAALFLLLGVRGRGGTVHCLFSDSRSEQLAGIGLLWAAVPVMNAVLFSRVPILALTEDGQEMGIRGLLKSSLFWLFIFIMVLRRGIGTGYEQWASAFAESGLMCQRQWEIWPDLVCFQFSWAYPGQCMPDTASASVSPPL